jgi:hypothetical protein|tara:strand:+ start:220 stop:378 length:159 start_codon:yes stop_codon:yes gene_type:complete
MAELGHVGNDIGDFMTSEEINPTASRSGDKTVWLGLMVERIKERASSTDSIA